MLKKSQASYDAALIPAFSTKTTLDIRKRMKDRLPLFLSRPFSSKLAYQWLQVNTFLQKSLVDVSHKGMRAASATAAVAGMMSAKPATNILKIDKPFSWAILQKVEDEWIVLFAGNVSHLP